MSDVELDAEEEAQLEAMRQRFLKRKREAAAAGAGGSEQDSNTAVLAGASPSPAKKKRSLEVPLAKGRRLFEGASSTKPSTSSSISSSNKYARPPPPRLAHQPIQRESDLLTEMDNTRQKLKHSESRRAHVRSTAFNTTARKPATTTATAATEHDRKGKGRASSEESDQEREYKPIRPQRDDNLELVHDLQPGPREFKPNPADPDWLAIEPNSGIRLKSRALPHEALQEHLSDRYHLPPELLYSLVRPSKGGTEYELPVEGDWVVIGVLADKSEIRHTGGGPTSGAGASISKEAAIKAAKAKEAARKRKEREDRRKRIESGHPEPGDLLLEEEDGIQSDSDLKDAFEEDPQAALDQQNNFNNKKSRRYVSFKLVDLKHRNAGGGTGVLNLKLFESDDGGKTSSRHEGDSSEDEYTTSTGITVRKEVKSSSSRTWTAKAKRAQDLEDGIDPSLSFNKRNYKGGSGGAYEKFWKAREGTVVALLNPKIMKPWQGYGSGPNPNSNILTLTPESAESMIVLGRAKDLGACQAKKKDGKLCGAWCDTRVADACEWHVQQAVKSRRAGRAEFFAGTGGMKTTSLSHDDYQQIKRGFPSSTSRSGYSSSQKQRDSETVYDPVARTGLLPTGAQTKGSDGLKTYVVGQGGGTSSSLNLSRRLAGGKLFKTVVQPPVSGDAVSRDANSGLSAKEKAVKRAREEKEMREMLRRDGGKSLGAKYLVKNVKSATSNTASAGGKKAEIEEQEERKASEAESSDAKDRERKKRVFDVKAVRKIGWDPSLIGDASSSKAKPKADVLALLNNPINAAPKLGPLPGKKVRSGVRVPDHLRAKDTLSATPDDWDDLEDPEEQAQARKAGSTSNYEKDSGFLFSSEDEDERDAGEEERQEKEAWRSEESDLEIEPPVTVELE